MSGIAVRCGGGCFAKVGPVLTPVRESTTNLPDRTDISGRGCIII